MPTQLSLFQKPPFLVGGQHKEAESIKFGTHRVEIKRKAYKRSMSVTVKPNGLVLVSVGKLVTQKRILRFLKDHTAWIDKQSEKLHSLRRRYPKPTFVTGSNLPYCGRRLTLELRETSRKRGECVIIGDTLLVKLPAEHQFGTESEKASEVRDLVLKKFKSDGRERLSEWVQSESQNMQVTPQGLSFRAQKSRWGSCSSKGRISLNWKLIVAPPEVQRYIVVHELAHLRHMNHSRAFWRFVAEFCSTVKECEKWLKHNHYEADFLSPRSELHS